MIAIEIVLTRCLARGKKAVVVQEFNPLNSVVADAAELCVEVLLSVGFGCLKRLELLRPIFEFI